MMRLKERSNNLVLIGWSPTRWSSAYLTFSRLVELRKPVTAVINEMQKIDNLSISEWNSLASYCEMMKEFSDVTHQLEGESYSSISLIVPSLKNIEMVLEEKRGVRGFQTAANTLLSALRKRFAY